MTKIKYYPPTYESESFNCAHCRVYSSQYWCYLRTVRMPHVGHIIQDRTLPDHFAASLCGYCRGWSIWIEEVLVYPAQVAVENPNEDMPEDVKKLYMESAQVLSTSPRAAAALLRLGLQILLGVVGGDGKNINYDIKKIVALGIEPETQRALDILRVFGNNGTHPGEIKLDEDPSLVHQMYGLMNYVTDRLITQKNQINELFESLPEGVKDQIESRDSKNKNKEKL